MHIKLKYLYLHKTHAHTSCCSKIKSCLGLWDSYFDCREIKPKASEPSQYPETCFSTQSTQKPYIVAYTYNSCIIFYTLYNDKCAGAKTHDVWKARLYSTFDACLKQFSL